MTNLPHFIHIGYPKTASTWLQDLFNTHKDICFVYKPKFFCFDDCFSKGKEFYQNLFHFNEGNKVFMDSDEAYAMGERFGSFGWDCCYKPKHSPAFGKLARKYLLPPDKELIARRIHETLPQAKIIMVLRNQTDWLVSLYKHWLIKWETRPFIKFVEELSPHGFYAPLVESYFRLFGRENVLVLFYEELVSNPVNFLDKISNFMGISKFDYSQIDNKARVSLTNRGAKILRKVNFIAGKIHWASKPVFYLDRSLFSKFNDSKLISPQDREYVANLYVEDNEKLAKLLNVTKLYA